MWCAIAVFVGLLAVSLLLVVLWTQAVSLVGLRIAQIGLMVSYVLAWIASFRLALYLTRRQKWKK